MLTPDTVCSFLFLLQCVHQANQQCPIFLRQDGAWIEQDAVFFCAGDDGRLLPAEFFKEPIRTFSIQCKQEGRETLFG